MFILKKLLRDEAGASAAEYALILAIVGTGIAGAAVILGGSIETAMTEASACIDADGCPAAAPDPAPAP